MTDDPSIEVLRSVFRPWQHAAASIPPPSALRDLLLRMVKVHHHVDHFEISFTPAQSRYFASAAIDIWHRAVHSLLVSTALTNQSSLWSCVTGYYATHYTFRALAHAVGHFQLFHERWMIRIRIEAGVAVGTFQKGRKREHDWYRAIVSHLPCLNTDPFFAPLRSYSVSDSSHRDHANYIDHLGIPPNIQSVDRDAIRRRMEQLAQMEVPEPFEFNLRSGPNVEAAQVNAYQRIARFRQFLDESLMKNRFWTTSRTPGWATHFTNFNFVEPRGADPR